VPVQESAVAAARDQPRLGAAAVAGRATEARTVLAGCCSGPAAAAVAAAATAADAADAATATAAAATATAAAVPYSTATATAAASAGEAATVAARGAVDRH